MSSMPMAPTPNLTPEPEKTLLAELPIGNSSTLCCVFVLPKNFEEGHYRFHPDWFACLEVLLFTSTRLPLTDNAYIQLSDGRFSLAARQYPVRVVHYNRTSKRWVRTPRSRRRNTQVLFDETLVHVSWLQPIPATFCRLYCVQCMDAPPRSRVSLPTNSTSELERRRRLKRQA